MLQLLKSVFFNRKLGRRKTTGTGRERSGQWAWMEYEVV
jgi:hypothetical protein